MLKSRDSWKTRDAMRDMTWRERIDYIWTYYNVHILITIGVAALVISVLSVVFAPKKQVVMSGVTVNIALTEQGEKALTEQLFADFGGTDPDKQETQFRQAELGQTEYGDTTGAEIMTLVGDIAARALDYLIMDEMSMSYLARGGWFGDITESMNQQQIEELSDRLYTVQMEDGQIVSVALEITDTEFIKSCAPKAKKAFLVLPGNTDRAELSDELLDWLLTWKAEQ